MQIVATTQNGVLIEATNKEVYEILDAVTGKRPDNLDIGQRIPAIDYATTITKVKALQEEHLFIYLKDKVANFNKHFDELVDAVDGAGSIEV